MKGRIMTLKEYVVSHIVNLFFKIASVVTLILTIVFSILALRGSISPEQFMTVFSVIIGFYFGTKQKNNADIKPETTEVQFDPDTTIVYDAVYENDSQQSTK